MKFYLSSFSYGANPEDLKNLLPSEAKVGIVPNAKDYKQDLEEVRQQMITECKNILSIDPQIIDLKEYFNQQEHLEQRVESLDLLWVCGGNTFILRHAMKLSGLDEILRKFHQKKHPLIYGGESAGSCVIGPTLEGIHLMDDPEINPYGEASEMGRDGIHLIDHSIIPHYKSTYGDGSMGRITEEIEQLMIEKNMPYKTLRDGEIIIIE